MTVFVYFAVTLLVFFVVGTGVLQAAGTVFHFDWKDKALVVPLVGLAVMMCLSQLLSIVFPTSVTSKLWWIVIFGVIIWQRKKLAENLWDILREYWAFWLGSLIILLVLAFPMVRENELLSVQYANNDIIYYLSTMDWLQDHNLLAAVQYTESTPYYLCAQYILSTTRFASDVLGSVIMTMFGIQAHEVFSFLGVCYVILCGMGVLYFAKNVLSVEGKYSTVISFAVMLCSSWKELLIMQYVPQMLGICCMVMFAAFVIQFFTENDRTAQVLASLFLVSTASTYSEFASYMFIIYAGIVLIQMACTRRFAKTLQSAIQTGILAILFNPLGFYIAVKFNLETLAKVSVSTDSIDAFGGRIKSLWDVIAGLVGGPSVGVFGNSLWQMKAYRILLAGGAVCFAVLIVWMLLRKRNKIYYFLCWMLAFFSGYELYFHKVRLAYGEYKHLVSIVVFMIIFLLYFVYELQRERRFRVCFLITAFVLFGINAINLKVMYPDEFVIKYDSELLEVRDGLELVPENTRVGILGNQHFIQHELIYAAKDHQIQIMGEGVNSYYTMLGIPTNNELPEFILCLRDSEELSGIVDSDCEEIWSNDRFMIVKCR